MADNEKLIEARAKLAQHAMRRDLGAMPKHIRTILDALAVFEKTHTPTDDERGAGWSHPEAVYSPEVFGAIQGLLNEANGNPMHALRLAVSRQVSKPQGEPSDAQVLSWLDAEHSMHRVVHHQGEYYIARSEVMRLVKSYLRDAGGVR